MLRDKLFYYLANYALQHSFEKEIIKLIKNERKLVVFDVGCYRGVFVKTILIVGVTGFLGYNLSKYFLYNMD